jgi:hypothetical protein
VNRRERTRYSQSGEKLSSGGISALTVQSS